MAIVVPWIRPNQIAKYPGLKAEDRLRLTSALIRETAIATALCIIHGSDWYQVYIDTGGQIRYDNADPPTILIRLDAIERHM